MRQQTIRQLGRFIAGLMSLDDFRAWVVSRMGDALGSHDEVLASVFEEVDADLIQVGEGLLDEATVRERAARHLARLETLAIESGGPRAEAVIAGSSSETVTAARQYHVFAA